MKILFLHPNMPGQYKHLCRAFAQDPANTVVFITKPKEDVNIPGVHKVEYKPPREPSASTHRYLIGTERGVIQGQEVWRMCKQLKTQEGFVPDVICAHPGWGDALYVKDIYPDTPLLSFFEFYYRSKGADVNFDPNDQFTEDDNARIRTKNIVNILSLESADWGLSPTRWQWIQHPELFRSKISVIHDGIDTDAVRPDPNAVLTLKDGRTLSRKDEVVTYVARNFEPYRGFPTFMRAAELILKRRPNCQIVAVGADGVSYGKQPPKGKTYRQMMLEEVKLDRSRIHFVGNLPYNEFLKVLQISSAHIYLTYPFVLSWSFLESMAAECILIGSSTPPVMEALTDGENGLLVDFFSHTELADKVDEVLNHPERYVEIRKRARQFVEQRYALKKLLPLHMELVRDVAKGQFPPPAHQKIEALYG